MNKQIKEPNCFSVVSESSETWAKECSLISVEKGLPSEGLNSSGN